MLYIASDRFVQSFASLVMDSVDIQQRYMKLTKKCLIISGIWPEQEKSMKKILRFIIYIATVPCIMSQIAYVACFFSLTAVVEQLSFLLAMVLGLFKQGAYLMNEEKFKVLLHGMFNDWTVARPKEEIAIMTSYMERGALFASIYLANAYSCTALFMQMPWWPRIADLVMPLNESRPRTYIFPAYYFVDDEDYYYWIIAHMSTATLLTTIIYIACDTCYIYVVQHACGLLAVAGYRFEQAIEDSPDERKTVEITRETYRKVRNSVEGHDRALKYVREIEDIHYSYLFFCMGIMVAAFSGTLVMVSKMEICMQFYQCCTFLIVQLTHMFFLTLQGQFVINSNDEAYNKIYGGLWYNAVPQTQILYILALRSSMTPPQMTAGRLIPMNLQTFADVIKTSVSYFTVLKTT